jgi:sphinganine C4-monooxygenase
MNNTICPLSVEGQYICRPSTVPFYHTDRPSLLTGIPDNVLVLAAPIVAYWFLSLFFHLLDISGWTWLEKYRIHETVEVKSRNRATRSDVVWAVLLQQGIQTALGVYWMTGETHTGDGRWIKEMQTTGSMLSYVVNGVLGKEIGSKVLRSQGADMVYFLYWWGIPIAQAVFAMFIIDTWQYFLHRLMHVNKFLYKQFHSVHHRLYVPYAFGALYNHPVEGFLLDSLGAVLGEAFAQLSIRQAILFFTFSTMKTVDDHCGYNFPFDPLQLFTRNNADYHDIHHQVIGIKSNFSQPFFVHWDVLLGTRLTRKDIELRRQKVQKTI